MFGISRIRIDTSVREHKRDPDVMYAYEEYTVGGMSNEGMIMRVHTKVLSKDKMLCKDYHENHRWTWDQWKAFIMEQAQTTNFRKED